MLTEEAHPQTELKISISNIPSIFFSALYVNNCGELPDEIHRDNIGGVVFQSDTDIPVEDIYLEMSTTVPSLRCTKFYKQWFFPLWSELPGFLSASIPLSLFIWFLILCLSLSVSFTALLLNELGKHPISCISFPFCPRLFPISIRWYCNWILSPSMDWPDFHLRLLP